MTNPRVAYLGLDHSHCNMYLQSIQELPLRLSCAYEPDEEFDVDGSTLPDGVPVYQNMTSLFESEDVDIAWISLPNNEAPDAVDRAASHDVDVYVEKTIARTATELEPIVESVEQNGITLATGYQNRCNAVSKALRERVLSGFFGSPRAVEARMITSQLAYRDTNDPVYHRDASRGGILQWLGCHYIDLIQWILDEDIARVSAQIDFGVDSVDVEDGATLQFETEVGCMGTLQAGYYDRAYDTYVAVHGTDGRGTWDRARGESGEDVAEFESYTDDGWSVAPRRTVTYDYDDAPGYGGTTGLDYVRAFLRAREGDEDAFDTIATIDDARRVLRVLDAAYESAESGKWVDVK